MRVKRVWLTTGLAVCLLVALVTGGSVLADERDQASSNAHVFEAVLHGSNEVPPVSGSALGDASMLLNQNGDTVFYTVMVTGASSTVTAAHIQMGRRGENGDVVVNLCGTGASAGCGTEGVIASGSITTSSFVGPLAGHPMSDLVKGLANGAAYVNVLTNNNPNGEIRGQVRSLQFLANVNGSGNGQGEDNGNHNGDGNGNGNHGDGNSQGQDDNSGDN
jgi:hypothetical protein